MRLRSIRECREIQKIPPVCCDQLKKENERLRVCNRNQRHINHLYIGMDAAVLALTGLERPYEVNVMYRVSCIKYNVIYVYVYVM